MSDRPENYHLCDHKSLSALEMLPDGRRQWICECGRTPTAADWMVRDSVISMMKTIDQISNM